LLIQYEIGLSFGNDNQQLRGERRKVIVSDGALKTLRGMTLR
jgi:hypothetical protein